MMIELVDLGEGECGNCMGLMEEFLVDNSAGMDFE